MYKIEQLKQIKGEDFRNVIMYSIAEPGAMGAPGMMEFITSDGRAFWFDYMSEETPYEQIREALPSIKECYFSGPAAEERRGNEPAEIVFYPERAERNRRTHVGAGWRHIYMGFGNHLVIREEYYDEFKAAISDLKTEVDIYCKWQDRALGLYGRKEP